MDCCQGLKIDIPEGAKKIVLAGNPNVGKSVFFNALTGLYVDVSNFPGTTVDISHGKYGKDVVIDTPGVYGVSSFNDEERVAKDVIIYGDIIVNVVDTLHIERDLFLTLQIIDMGKPVVVALNMMDDVERNGINLDIDKLSELLGVPVIPTVATQGKGIEEVKKNIYNARVGKINPEIYDLMKQYKDIVEYESEALMIVEEDEDMLKKYNLQGANKREESYTLRRKKVDDIVSKIIKNDAKGSTFRQRLGYYMLNPLTGIPILAIVLYVMFKVIGIFVAGTVVGFTEGTIMNGMYEPIAKGLFGSIFGDNTLLYRVFAGDYGLFTLTPTYVLGLLMPLVIAFYFFMSLMEDSGYLPRIAALTDRVLSFLGLNGRAIIPLILGLGCVTMATITTRLLGTRREKVIATALLGLTIPCSAQIGVIAGMIAPLGAKYLTIYLVTVLIVFVVTGTTLNKLLPGESSHLFIDLPPIRTPRIGNVLTKTWSKTWMFIKEATPLFAIGALVITVLNESGVLIAAQNLFAPVTVKMLQLPKEAATAFIMGIIRRDFGAAGLTALVMTPAQSVVALVVITLFVPCIASIMIMFKERSKIEAITIWVGSFIMAFVVGGILSRILI